MWKKHFDLSLIDSIHFLYIELTQFLEMPEGLQHWCNPKFYEKTTETFIIASFNDELQASLQMHKNLR